MEHRGRLQSTKKDNIYEKLIFGSQSKSLPPTSILFTIYCFSKSIVSLFHKWKQCWIKNLEGTICISFDKDVCGAMSRIPIVELFLMEKA